MVDPTREWMQDVKARSRRLSALVDSFGDAYAAEVGEVQRVCVVDRAAKNGKLVAHNKWYTQVSGPPFLCGSSWGSSLEPRTAAMLHTPTPVTTSRTQR